MPNNNRSFIDRLSRAAGSLKSAESTNPQNRADLRPMKRVLTALALGVVCIQLNACAVAQSHDQSGPSPAMTENKMLGALLGGAAGVGLGSLVGRGGGNIAAMAGGGVLGAVVGSNIGGQYDRNAGTPPPSQPRNYDSTQQTYQQPVYQQQQTYQQQSPYDQQQPAYGQITYADNIVQQRAQLLSYTVPLGESVQWRSQDGLTTGSFTPTADGYDRYGRYCRTVMPMIHHSNGIVEQQGTIHACHQHNGSWQLAAIAAEDVKIVAFAVELTPRALEVAPAAEDEAMNTPMLS